MAENEGNNAAGATPNPSGTPNPTPQPDMVSIPRGEYDKMTRYGDQVRGFQPFHQKAQAFGFKSAEDFDNNPWLKQIQTLEKRGVKADMLGRMFSDEAEADLNDNSKAPAIDLDKRDAELMNKWRREQAEEQWRSGISNERKIFEAAAAELKAEFPDVPPFLLNDAIVGRAEQIRELYDEKHPLHKDYAKPHDDNFKTKLSGYYKAEKAKFAGESMKAKADATIASEKDKKSPPSAGKSGGNGAPNQSPPDKRPYGKPSREAVEAAHQAKKDSRGRGAA